jgi:hypothetical protein
VSIVPWRAPAPAVRAPRTPARRTGNTPARPTPSAPAARPTARGPIGFAVAFIDTQRDIGRGKRARRAAQAELQAAKLRADYERAGRMSLPAPKPPELNP